MAKNVLVEIGDEEVDGAQGYKLYTTQVCCDDLPLNRLGPKLLAISSLLHRFVTPRRDVQMVMIYMGYALRVTKKALANLFPKMEAKELDAKTDFNIVNKYVKFCEQVLYDFSTLGLENFSMDAYNDAYQKIYDQVADLIDIVGDWETEIRLWAQFTKILSQIMGREIHNVETTEADLRVSFFSETEKVK